MVTALGGRQAARATIAGARIPAAAAAAAAAALVDVFFKQTQLGALMRQEGHLTP
jgi:hypothetical protein